MKINKDEHQSFYTKKHNRRIKELEKDINSLTKARAVLIIVSMIMGIIFFFTWGAMLFAGIVEAKSVKTTVSIKPNICNTCIRFYNYRPNILQKYHCVRICRAYINNIK